MAPLKPETIWLRLKQSFQLPYLKRYGSIEAYTNGTHVPPGSKLPYLKRYGSIEAHQNHRDYHPSVKLPYLKRYGSIEAFQQIFVRDAPSRVTISEKIWLH